MAQISDEGNIESDKIDKFLMIHQNFLYQIAIANVAPATALLLIICRFNVNLSLIKNLCYMVLLFYTATRDECNILKKYYPILILPIFTNSYINTYIILL